MVIKMDGIIFKNSQNSVFGFQRGLRPKAVLKIRKGLHGTDDEEFLVEYEAGEPNKEWVPQGTFQESSQLAMVLLFKLKLQFNQFPHFTVTPRKVLCKSYCENLRRNGPS